MPSTYNKIEAKTLGSTASTVTFTSIPGTYTDLVLIISPIITTGSKDVCVQFNGDTGTNYSNTILSGDGSTASSARLTGQVRIFLDYYAVVNTAQSNRVVNIMNYSNATTYKTVLSRANNAGAGTDAIIGLWRSTAAITSMVLNAQTGGTFDVGSTFTLYGIKAA
jgi:hypothetical protein